ncbi:hypothetical protein [Enterovirga sp.]|uniref:hypothetical protein n=1 Tax=Enterovirga sp. TaxID=2026350 RepID=UPI002C0298CA|nr:hypothetical protein [Enterovirga sp.]HMO30228.1 hypothetical protein [Enterovirga sp.]
MTNIRHLGEIHIQSAKTKALQLFAFSGAIFPGEWIDSYVQEVTRVLLEFAFHARRVNQLCGIDVKKLSSIKIMPVTISKNDPSDWIEKYSDALNYLIHAKEFTFGNCHTDHRILFTNTKSNLIPLYVRVTTDQKPVGTISLFGLSHCFLSEIIPLSRDKFPNWDF